MLFEAEIKNINEKYSRLVEHKYMLEFLSRELYEVFPEMKQPGILDLTDYKYPKLCYLYNDISIPEYWSRLEPIPIESETIKRNYFLGDSMPQNAGSYLLNFFSSTLEPYSKFSLVWVFKLKLAEVQILVEFPLSDAVTYQKISGGYETIIHNKLSDRHHTVSFPPSNFFNSPKVITANPKKPETPDIMQVIDDLILKE